VSPGAYQMQVGMYLLSTGERLAVEQDGAPERDFVQVNEVIVVPR
jgi:hypothetical protein